MNFDLTPEQTLLRDSVRALMDKIATPTYIRDKDEAEEYPEELFQAWAAMGLLGLLTPVDKGGSGGTIMDEVVVAEEMAHKAFDLAGAFALVANNARIIARHGTDEQIGSLLPEVFAGRRHLCLSMTEPHAGSDVLAMRTTARRDGSDWVINGSKIYATAAAVPSSTILLYCKTDIDEDPRKSMTVFLLPNDTPGLDIRKIRMLGRHMVPTTEIFLDDVRLPDHAVLGGPGNGWKILLSGLQEERVSNPAAYVGNAQTVIDETLEYVKQRQVFGGRLGDFQVVAHRIADMQTRVDAARLMTYRAATMLDDGQDALSEVCMAKLFAAEVFVDVTNEGMQLLGGYGYTMEAPMQRHFRAARGCTITGGSSEMQRQTIARRLGLRPH